MCGLILFAHCSKYRKDALVALQNGSIRVYQLSDRKDLGQLGPYWTGWAHNLDYGDVSSVAFSHDDRYVFSTGLDGNVFVFQTAETAKFMFGGKAKVLKPETMPSFPVLSFLSTFTSCLRQGG